MSILVRQQLRGTTDQINKYEGKAGQLVFNTDTNDLHVFTGSGTTNKKFVNEDNLNYSISSKGFVTTTELEAKNYVTTSALEGKNYVTNDVLNSKNYVTNDVLSSKNYVDNATLEGKGYLTQSTADSKYLTKKDGSTYYPVIDTASGPTSPYLGKFWDTAGSAYITLESPDVSKYVFMSNGSGGAGPTDPESARSANVFAVEYPQRIPETLMKKSEYADKGLIAFSKTVFVDASAVTIDYQLSMRVDVSDLDGYTTDNFSTAVTGTGYYLVNVSFFCVPKNDGSNELKSSSVITTFRKL